MINTFFVENYKNISMPYKLEIKPEVSFVYGICGSGKTNFCMALSDIFMNRETWDLASRQGARFEYGFYISGMQIWCGYTRNQIGRLCCIEVIIPHLNFFYVKKNSVINMGVVWSEIIKGCHSREVKQVIATLQSKLLSSKIWIPDLFVARKNLERNKGEQEKCERQYETSDSSFIICDDSEWIGVQTLEEQIKKIKSQGNQGIFVVRRNRWMDDQYTAPDRFYHLEKGTPRIVASFTDKDIRRSSQLKCIMPEY